MKNAQHLSLSNEWYSPPDIVESARAVLGIIDLDPATSDLANKTIRAERIITEDSLSSNWADERPVSIYLNAPGGKVGNQSQAVLFWQKLQDLRVAGDLKHAIVICFSMEIFQTSQQCAHSVVDFPLCIPGKRLKYSAPEGKPRSPTHASAIVYVPGTFDSTEVFVANFKKFGKVLNANGR